jgi:hypothetical protein
MKNTKELLNTCRDTKEKQELPIIRRVESKDSLILGMNQWPPSLPPSHTYTYILTNVYIVAINDKYWTILGRIGDVVRTSEEGNCLEYGRSTSMHASIP